MPGGSACLPKHPDRLAVKNQFLTKRWCGRLVLLGEFCGRHRMGSFLQSAV